MTKAQLADLRPGDRVQWVEPESPEDHGVTGTVKPRKVAGVFAIQWADREFLASTHESKARYLKKLKN